MVPDPASRGRPHPGLYDRAQRAGEELAAGLDEAGGAAADHLRHQAFGVPVLVLLGDRVEIGVAPVLEPVAGPQIVRDKPAGELDQMGVAVDQPRHDQLERGVDGLFGAVGGVQLRRLADRRDAVAADRDGAVGDDAPLAVDGEDRAVPDQDVDRFRRHGCLPACGKPSRGPRARQGAPWGRDYPLGAQARRRPARSCNSSRLGGRPSIQFSLRGFMDK